MTRSAGRPVLRRSSDLRMRVLMDSRAPKLQEPPELAGQSVRVVGYPSKSHALVLGDRGGEAVFIFRSDSNGEDLEG